MRRYEMKCRKTGRVFAMSEEQVKETIKGLTNWNEMQTLIQSFDNLKDGDTLVLLYDEVIVPGEKYAANAL